MLGGELYCVPALIRSKSSVLHEDRLKTSMEKEKWQRSTFIGQDHDKTKEQDVRRKLAIECG